MSSSTPEPETTKEQRILRMMKKVLTDVAKDTQTPAHMKHPLSEHTIMGIRECLQLITAREAEILQEQNLPASSSHPEFKDGKPKSAVKVELVKPKK